MLVGTLFGAVYVIRIVSDGDLFYLFKIFYLQSPFVGFLYIYNIPTNTEFCVKWRPTWYIPLNGLLAKM